MDKRHRDLVEQGDKLFSDRRDLDSLWQEIALNFYPEMAQFTNEVNIGKEFASDLTTSYPLIARRTLGDALSALLRPVNLDTTSPGVWFGIRAHNDDRNDYEARGWLERATKIQRHAMYEHTASFVRATKEGDHSFATFGQCVIQVGLNRMRTGLLYRSHHLKDVVWIEDSEGKICQVHRNWNPTAAQAAQTFGDKVHSRVKEALTKEPYCRIKTRHIVVDAESYEYLDKTIKRKGAPWVSIWIDVDNQHVMEETPSHSRIYIIPRWATNPGSQYAYSPAVYAAMPDGRLIQAMSLTLLEAGEKFANPPLVTRKEVLRTDVNAYAGGLTHIDIEYDERLGDAIKPIYQPTAGQGVGIGMELRAGVQEALSKAFFLDSFSLPPAITKEMTRFEVQQRVSEWIRRATPILEPIEFEYNGPICDETFEILMRNGAFGSLQDIPQSLRGSEVRFKFESPLHKSVERNKINTFMEIQEVLQVAAQIDPSVVPIINATESLRDISDAIEVPTRWINSYDDVAKINAEREEQMQAQQMMMEAEPAAAAMKDVGAAVKSITDAARPDPKPAAKPTPKKKAA